MKKTTFRIAALVALVLLAGPVQAETCGCDVGAERLRAYDQALLETSFADAVATHAPWGLPFPTEPTADARVLVQPDWITGYDPELRMPVWEVHRLTATDLQSFRPRTQCFRPDPRLKNAAGSARCATYRRSGFDRGHLVPSADMVRAEAAMVNTYVFSNIAPQYPAFNRGPWAQIEQTVRDLTNVHGEVFVMSGAVFDHDANGRRDLDAAVPLVAGMPGADPAGIASAFYKIALWRETGGAVQRRIWLLAHLADADGAVPSTAQISDIERLTGLRLFPLLPADAEQARLP